MPRGNTASHTQSLRTNAKLREVHKSAIAEIPVNTRVQPVTRKASKQTRQCGSEAQEPSTCTTLPTLFIIDFVTPSRPNVPRGHTTAKDITSDFLRMIVISPFSTSTTEPYVTAIWPRVRLIPPQTRHMNLAARGELRHSQKRQESLRAPRHC